MDKTEEDIESENDSVNESADESSVIDETDDNDIPDKNLVLDDEDDPEVEVEDEVEDEDEDEDEDKDKDEDEDEDKLLYPASQEDKKPIKKELESTKIDIKDKYEYSVYNYKENENNAENNLIKFDDETKQNYLLDLHPECISKNFQEIKILTKILRDKNNVIIDEFHKTLPILTKYEKTKIIGIRTKQLNNGSPPYISVDEKIIDNYVIANMEIQEKKLPFIISRPLPNKNFEYWKLQDLEIL
tara:strand:+ start:87 stop:818 length:732 start_codon:yes stop_codon:yes gene_type:complete